MAKSKTKRAKEAKNARKRKVEHPTLDGRSNPVAKFVYLAGKSRTHEKDNRESRQNQKPKTKIEEGGRSIMGIFTDIVEALREKDEVELALKVCGLSENEGTPSACKKYMSPSRFNDFAKAIAELMDSGKSYGDAKAEVFDETEMPPKGSECCNQIWYKVKQIREK